MKHLVTSLLAIFSSLSLLSQPTIVSTNPENRKVILEEFTGTNCQFCPYGHLISTQIMEANPDKAYAINIHTGPYAPTSPASVNYTTAYGNSIATQAGASSIGYPCGTINRHLYTGSVLAMGRGSWGTYTGQALLQSSPVNLAINVELDYLTRQMTVLVEVYYTATSSASTNMLNVAIIQDWVKGPQVNSAGNPDYVTPDGQYYHMHMLRELITGQWGVTIPTTTMGTFWDSTFVFNIPTSYAAIPAELRNLKVVAFVAEGQTEILTADEESAPRALIDACLTSASGIPAVLCDPTFTPSVTITNEGENTLTSFNINYSIDGGSSAIFSWAGSLPTDSSVTVAIPAMTVGTTGAHSFSAIIADPNNASDLNISNDSISQSFSLIDDGSLPVSQDFSGTAFPPADFIAVDSGEDGSNWVRNNAGHLANGSALIKWYIISNGQKDDLMISPLDLSSANNMNLSFFIAHRQYNSSNDKLQVDVSTDCGTTWTTVWSKSGSALATGSVMTSEFTSPSSGEWRQEFVDLSTYCGQSDVFIRFHATSNYGNNLFIDEINVSPNVSTDDRLYTLLNMFPNPAEEFISAGIISEASELADFTIINVLGEVVCSYSEWINAGSNTTFINTSTLNNGVYYLRVQKQDEIYIGSFVVKKQ